MPTKGQRTRHHIVATAASVFNVRGFAGTSISDVLEATGLEKGGLYRHFASKDELALAAFDHAVKVQRAHHDAVQSGAKSPFDKLVACIDAVAQSVSKPAISGGCPILNTAIEADDTHNGLRARAAAAMREWQAGVARIAQGAIDAGELRSDADPKSIAAILISASRGGHDEHLAARPPPDDIDRGASPRVGPRHARRPKSEGAAMSHAAAGPEVVTPAAASFSVPKNETKRSQTADPPSANLVEHGVRRGLVVLGIMLAVLFEILDTTIVNVGAADGPGQPRREPR